MKPKRFIIIVAICLCFFSAAGAALASLTAGSERTTELAVGVGINSIISIFLILGFNWARWGTVVLLGLSIVSGIIGGIALIANAPSEFPIIDIIIMIGTMAVSLAINISIVLCLLSRKAVEHFTPWQCDRCSEQNEGTSYTCWECNLERYPKAEPVTGGNG
tara:strand:- start:28933 stop:29418 length:486 start_codon:yes stop_codon:yes gene_type:complete